LVALEHGMILKGRGELEAHGKSQTGDTVQGRENE
jgi:hypothetical protein